jgi:hypothetical protein
MDDKTPKIGEEARRIVDLVNLFAMLTCIGLTIAGMIYMVVMKIIFTCVRFVDGKKVYKGIKEEEPKAGLMEQKEDEKEEEKKDEEDEMDLDDLEKQFAEGNLDEDEMDLDKLEQQFAAGGDESLNFD